jgi:hypothetical protein
MHRYLPLHFDISSPRRPRLSQHAPRHRQRRPSAQLLATKCRRDDGGCGNPATRCVVGEQIGRILQKGAL